MLLSQSFLHDHARTESSFSCPQLQGRSDRAIASACLSDGYVVLIDRSSNAIMACREICPECRRVMVTRDAGMSYLVIDAP